MLVSHMRITQNHFMCTFNSDTNVYCSSKPLNHQNYSKTHLHTLLLYKKNLMDNFNHLRRENRQHVQWPKKYLFEHKYKQMIWCFSRYQHIWMHLITCNKCYWKHQRDKVMHAKKLLHCNKIAGADLFVTSVKAKFKLILSSKIKKCMNFRRRDGTDQK